MTDAHEQIEHAEHVEHAAHANKGIALLISVLALFLALSETLGKSAQTTAISDNVRASDTWAFYQAKTIRSSALQIASQAMTIESGATGDPKVKEAQGKQIDVWKKESARLDDEPGKEGRKQLMDRANQAEEDRDLALARYHHYETSSAAFQIGIVLASATIITGMTILAWISGGLGVVGLVFMGIGLFAPHAVHLV
ncbi:MAG TPA: DUF4337 domain-containing protein [Xanthobacteraceae bacterium]|nr:DUF4337 domain-containing protein [Xanthobacteraceae bacterium]